MGVFSKAFEGCSVVRQNARVYGTVDGFYFDTVQVPSPVEIVTTIYYNCENPSIRPEINQVFLNLKSHEKKLRSIEINDHTIVVHQQSQSAKKVVALTELVTKQLITFLKLKGCTSGCGVCGSENPGFYEINGGMHCLCESCAKDVVTQLESNKAAHSKAKSKLVPGLIGAFIGALIGVALWIVIYQMGYIAGIAGAVTMICAMKGWEKMGGHLDVKGVIISFAIAIAMIFIAEQVSWALVVSREFNKRGYETSFFEVYKELGDLIKLADATGDFVGELVVGYLLSLLVGVPYIINAFKEASGSYSVKKL